MKDWSALILAGGAGRRFGGGKLLADLAGTPVIRRVVESVSGAGFGEVVIVTGAEDAALRASLEGFDCRIVHAANWTEGMAATLRKGTGALAGRSQGVCLFLGDMPLVPVTLCPELIERAQLAGYAARPKVGGEPGHPVAFTRAAFADLLALTGDRGATALLRARADVAYLETNDPGALLDIDTPGDLAAAVRAWKA